MHSSAGGTGLSSPVGFEQTQHQRVQERAEERAFPRIRARRRTQDVGPRAGGRYGLRTQVVPRDLQAQGVELSCGGARIGPCGDRPAPRCNRLVGRRCGLRRPVHLEQAQREAMEHRREQ
jgi:hypothetical protein